MKTITMIQNSDEWLEIRKKYLGASDANIILGDDKNKITPLMLFNQKAHGIEIDTSGAEFIFAKGHRLEDKMRNIMEMVLDHDLKPLVVLSEEYKFLMASLDGYSEETGATWECKYVGQDAFDEVANGNMMMNYYPQVQQQIMLTGAPYCVFTVVTDDKESTNPDFPFKYTFIEVPANLDYMKNTLIPAMTKFWDHVNTKTPPEAVHNDVLNMDENSELVDLLGNYYGAKIALEEITKKEKELKTAIFKMCKSKKVTCSGVKITQSKPSESDVFDHKKFQEKNGIPEGFLKIKKNASKKTITFPKPKTEEEL